MLSGEPIDEQMHRCQNGRESSSRSSGPQEVSISPRESCSYYHYAANHGYAVGARVGVLTWTG